jgi:hypothetical protein
MVERRSLVEGVKSAPATDNVAERAFVYKKVDAAIAAQATTTLNRAPISTRIREDFAKALKRASLERQLNGAEPNTLQDILEEAIEPWLRNNGYLP